MTSYEEYERKLVLLDAIDEQNGTPISSYYHSKNQTIAEALDPAWSSSGHKAQTIVEAINRQTYLMTGTMPSNQLTIKEALAAQEKLLSSPATPLIINPAEGHAGSGEADILLDTHTNTDRDDSISGFIFTPDQILDGCTMVIAYDVSAWNSGAVKGSEAGTVVFTYDATNGTYTYGENEIKIEVLKSTSAIQIYMNSSSFGYRDNSYTGTISVYIRVSKSSGEDAD